ncbi:MAG: DUF3786 domain-containing protein [Desulfobacterales bacterium]|nr:DUF3786 domain-containing protein [Desulfobacterales bacterium]
MSRIDDYINAKKLAVETLKRQDIETVVLIAGFEIIDNAIRIPFIDRVYIVSIPDFEFKDETAPDKEVPIQEQVLIMHYLTAEIKPVPTGNRVAYREIPGATFYFSTFAKRAIDPLKNTFGNNIPGLLKAVEKTNGKKIDLGDAGFEYYLFPKVPIQLILWEGDDEFPAEANILFDETIGKILLPEDIAWLAGMLVYRMMELSR